MKNLFITFEGGEGSGKTTQIQLLAGHLRREGRTVLTTREPGGTRIGDAIRELLLDSTLSEMSDRAEALLYAASRAQLVDEVIKPALAEDKVVICDRYIDSSVAYQAFARGLDREAVENISLWATGNLLPDLTFLLKIPAEKGLFRAITGEADRIEREEITFHEQVEAGYNRLAAENPLRFRIIEAAADIELVHARIAEIVDLKLKAG